jgi:protein-S-isoprenylcysteine O-methyltransferase Ste14
MVAAGIVIAVGWLAFWSYWFVSALGAKSSSRSRRPAYIGTRVLVIAVVLLLLRLHVVPARVLRDAPWAIALGLVLFFAGLGLAVWARLYIGRNWGMPMSQKDEPELVTTGPYSKVRHPIYTGLIIAMIGTALAISLLWLAITVILGGFFIFSATREERYMTSQFPATYPAYKRSTKMLIPYII